MHDLILYLREHVYTCRSVSLRNDVIFCVATVTTRAYCSRLTLRKTCHLKNHYSRSLQSPEINFIFKSIIMNKSEEVSVAEDDRRVVLAKVSFITAFCSSIYLSLANNNLKPNSVSFRHVFVSSFYNRSRAHVQ
jgi:hypothetical protein